ASDPSSATTTVENILSLPVRVFAGRRFYRIPRRSSQIDQEGAAVAGRPDTAKAQRLIGGVEQHLPGAQVELGAVAVADQGGAVDHLAVAHERAAGVGAVAIGGDPPVRVPDQRQGEAVDLDRQDRSGGRLGVDIDAGLGHASQTTGSVFAARTIQPWTTGSRSGSSRRPGSRAKSSSTVICATCRAT